MCYNIILTRFDWYLFSKRGLLLLRFYIEKLYVNEYSTPEKREKINTLRNSHFEEADFKFTYKTI